MINEKIEFWNLKPNKINCAFCNSIAALFQRNVCENGSFVMILLQVSSEFRKKWKKKNNLENTEMFSCQHITFR